MAGLTIISDSLDWSSKFSNYIRWFYLTLFFLFTDTFEEKKYSLVNFAANGDTLKSEVVWWGFGVPTVDKIHILGQVNKISAVYLNKKPIHFTYNKITHLLTVNKLNLPLDNVFTLKWE